MEHKTSEAFITGVEQDQGIIRAIFSVMGNVDLGNDRIHNGAFTKTFAERGHKVLVLDQHRTDSINRAIAKTMHLRELNRDELPIELLSRFPDATGGAEITAQFSLDDDDSKKAFFRLRNQWVNEWSFGYDAFDTSYSREDINGKQASVREIRTIKLYEVSPVLFGMNDATMTTGAKSTGDKTERIKNAFEFWQKDNYDFDRLEGHDLIAKKDGIEFTVLYKDCGDSIEFEILGGESMKDKKGASGKLDLPLASREMAWDSTKAVASIRQATGSTESPSSSYKNGFFWYDSEDDENFGAYKLPFAQAEEGGLKAVPRGIFAVAAALQGSRGGVDLPESDMDAVKQRVSRYYAKMRDEFNDDSLVPPWEKSKEEDEKSEQEETEQKESLQDEQNQETDSKEEKAGRAISKRNEECIRSAITGMQSAIEALNGLFPMQDEPEEEMPEDEMELSSDLNTVTIGKSNITVNISDDAVDLETLATMIKTMLKIDKEEKQSEHETETDEAGPTEELPTDTEVKESPFDFDKAFLELEQLKLEVQDNE